MAQRPVGCQPQKLFGVAEISGCSQRAGGQNRGFACVPQGAAEQLRYAVAGRAECELAVCGKLKVQDARRHIQEKKAQQWETISRLREVLPQGLDAKKTEDFIIKACDYYRKYLIRQRNRDER